MGQYEDFDNDDEVYEDDENLSFLAQHALDNLHTTVFPISFSMLPLYEKIIVSKIAGDVMENVMESDNSFTAEEMLLMGFNSYSCGISIMYDIHNLSSRDRLWIISDPETDNPLLLPDGWIETKNKSDFSCCGILAATTSDGAEDILDFLEENGVNASVHPLEDPGCALSFFFEHLGANWFCLANDTDNFIYIDSVDYKTDFGKLNGLFLLYNQPNIQEDENAKDSVLRQIVSTLRFAQFACPVKYSTDGNEISIDIALMDLSSEEDDNKEEANFVVAFTNEFDLKAMHIPFDYKTGWFSFYHLLLLANEFNAGIMINPMSGEFVVPGNIWNLMEECLLDEQLNGILEDFNTSEEEKSEKKDSEDKIDKK